MREILFRAKLTFNGTIGSDKWIESSNIRIRNSGDGHILFINGLKADEETLGQFSGLVDRNNKKDFEGDLSIHAWSQKEIFKTIFYKGRFLHELISDPNYHYYLEPCHFNNYVIIGNIHDK